MFLSKSQAKQLFSVVKVLVLKLAHPVSVVCFEIVVRISGLPTIMGFYFNWFAVQIYKNEVVRLDWTNSYFKGSCS